MTIVNEPPQPPTGTPQDTDERTQDNVTQQDTPTVKLSETINHQWKWNVNVMGIVRDGISMTRLEGLVAGYKKAVELTELWHPDRLKAVKEERDRTIEAERNEDSNIPVSSQSSSTPLASTTVEKSADPKPLQETPQPSAATSQQSETAPTGNTSTQGEPPTVTKEKASIKGKPKLEDLSPIEPKNMYAKIHQSQILSGTEKILAEELYFKSKKHMPYEPFDAIIEDLMVRTGSAYSSVQRTLANLEKKKVIRRHIDKHPKSKGKGKGFDRQPTKISFLWSM